MGGMPGRKDCGRGLVLPLSEQRQFPQVPAAFSQQWDEPHTPLGASL